MEEFNANYSTMTVRCLLCRGLVIYKNGDITRFTAHLANEHGAFFDIEYLLASCFMDEGQKETIANPIRASLSLPPPPPSPSTVYPGSQYSEDNPQDDFKNILPADQLKQEVGGAETFSNTYENTEDMKEQMGDTDESIRAPKENEKRSHKNVAELLAAQGIDIKKTVFLSNESRGVADGSKYVSQFTETLPFLPEGWRMKKQMNGKLNGVAKFTTQYLSPNLLKFFTGAGVVEYLHLEGKHSREEVLEVARGFKLKLKLKKIISDLTPEELKAGGTIEDGSGGIAYDANTTADSDESVNMSSTSETSFNTSASGSLKIKKEPTSVDNVKTILAREGMDISKSPYFMENGKNVISGNLSSKIAEQFTEAVAGLPTGWKSRSLEVKVNGKQTTQKQYLSPSGVLLKTTMGVVDFLRIEGKLSPAEVLDVAKCLRVGPKKLNKMFGSESGFSNEDEKAVVTGDIEVTSQTMDLEGGLNQSVEESFASSESESGACDTTFESAADSLMEELNNLEEELQTDINMEENLDTAEKENEDPQKNSVRAKLEAIGINLNKSAYFSSCVKAGKVANVQSKKVSSYSEINPCLPDGWKYKTIEKKMKGGRVTTVKHYLTPDNIHIQFALIVVEYLRLEGKMKYEQLMDVAKSLKVGQEKIKKLFSEVNSTAETKYSEGGSTEDARVKQSESFDNQNIHTQETPENESSVENSLDVAADILMKELDQSLKDLDKDIAETSTIGEPELNNDHSDDASVRSKKEGSERQKFFDAQEVDVKKSPYLFDCLKNGSVTDGSKLASSFTETLDILPDGWKYRTFETKINGKVTTLKHYLSPSNILFKFSMAVVEYLRLEGKMKHEHLLEVAKGLKVGPKKIKKLFDSSVSEKQISV